MHRHYRDEVTVFMHLPGWMSWVGGIECRGSRIECRVSITHEWTITSAKLTQKVKQYRLFQAFYTYVHFTYIQKWQKFSKYTFNLTRSERVQAILYAAFTGISYIRMMSVMLCNSSLTNFYRKLINCTYKYTKTSIWASSKYNQVNMFIQCTLNQSPAIAKCRSQVPFFFELSISISKEL